MAGRRSERAAVAPVLVGVIALVAASTAGVGRIATASVLRARADAAADLVALAAAHDPQRAELVAQRSGVRIERIRSRPDGSTEVRIERDGVGARAAATVVSMPSRHGGDRPPR